ncbi:MAG: hypothetical protein IT371_20890 [Deltaproteobacteria bacterium]|nr:hypothetical protein [Deltaproteobacteria bacterium]
MDRNDRDRGRASGARSSYRRAVAWALFVSSGLLSGGRADARVQGGAGWPVAAQFFEAVQTPNLAFSDGALAAAQVRQGRHGLPWVASGNFASVYRLVGAVGSYAVRCFLRPEAQREDRYRRISEELGRRQLPLLAGFEYQPAGLRLGVESFPLVKMDWVEGVPLDAFVGDCARRRDGAALDQLATRWFGAMRELRAAGIAHGDLQHGNVLVERDGRLRLVDYDGMYVPSMRGLRAVELGHSAYQSPRRRASDFGPELDHFASLVIYLSLRAVAQDPGLFTAHHTGDNLIFTRGDLRAPGGSRLLARLAENPSREVQGLARLLTALAPLPLHALPHLEELVDERGVLRAGVLARFGAEEAAAAPPPVAPAGSYRAEISRRNPGLVFFVLDRSTSMRHPMAGDAAGRSKAQAAADAVNRQLQSLTVRATKGEVVWNYYSVGALAYSGLERALLEDALPAVGQGVGLLAPIGQLAGAPRRVRRDAQGRARPEWVEPIVQAGTPMRAALGRARETVAEWARTHPSAYPPIVVHVTDGSSTDGDARGEAAALRQVATADGAALLFNVHVSHAGGGRPILFPETSDDLPDDHARRLFEMSSPLPPHLIAAARAVGLAVGDRARGFAYNADLAALTSFLDLGTRPANLE